MSSYTSFLKDFIGGGLAADLPDPTVLGPEIPVGQAAFYYASDTNVFYKLASGQTAWHGATIASIEVTDGTHDFTGITKLLFTGAVVSNPGGTEAEVAIPVGATVTDGTHTENNVTTFTFSGATVSTTGVGEVTINITGGGGSLTVTDGTTTETGVTTLTFSGATVSSTGAGEASVAITGGGGSSWDFNPPHAASFTVHGANWPGSTSPANTLTLTDDSDVGLMIDSGAVGTPSGGFAAIAIPTPSADWAFIAKIRLFCDTSNYVTSGILVSDGTKTITIGRAANTSTLNVFSASSYSYNILAGVVVEWFRIRQMGSTLYFEVSPDGKQWALIHSESATAYLTGGPSIVGVQHTVYRSSGLHVLASIPYMTLTGATL